VNQKIKCWVLGVFLSFGLVACKSGEVEELHERLSVKLDPSLTQKEKSTIRGDLLELFSQNIATKDGWFSEVFGGNGTESVIEYMDARVNYIIPERVKLVFRVGFGSIVESEFFTKNKTVTVASNMGMALWLTSLSQRKRLTFRIGDVSVPMDDPRNGLIQIGTAYIGGKTKTKMDTNVRNNTLVHEARHSDCTGGVYQSDIDRMKVGELPTNPLCGHTHVMCPDGHDFEGYYACDGHAWGAYSVGGVFSAAISKYCENCTEADRQKALIEGLDSFSRVLVLDKMKDGLAGAPNMTSSRSVIGRNARELFRDMRASRKNLRNRDINFIEVEVSDEPLKDRVSY